MSDTKHHFQRVRWHSRRGLLELDIVLVSFADQYFQLLPEYEQDAYVKLLNCEDQDLLSWWLQTAIPVDNDICHILTVIRERHGSASSSPH